MDIVSHFRRMARNNLWSNDRIYLAVAALQPGEFEADRTSFFPSLRATLNHILEVDLYYLDMVEEGGQGRRVLDRFTGFDSVSELAVAQVECDRRLVAFFDGLSEADIDRRVSTDRGEAGVVAERIGDILSHLFIHQIHHRGQVHAMLSGTSVAPPQLDEFFLDYDLQFRRDEVARLKL